MNNGIVNISHFKVSHGDIISFRENYARTRGEEIRRFFYIKISVEKIIGKFWGRQVRMQRRNKRRSKTKWLRRVRMWRKIKTGWFRRLKTKKRCRLLLKDKDRFLQKLHSSMQEEDLERTKKFGSDAEHNRMKRNLYHSVTLFLSKKRRKKRMELPTHYSEVNHRTLKVVVSYGPNIDHIPHDIRLKDPNLPLQSGKGRGQNT
ncbi:Ribosomal protein S4 mitochondrial [Bienertia sinuspersici]